MSTQVNAPFFSRTAGQDMTGHRYKVVKINASKAALLSAAGTDRHAGVLESEDVSGQPVSIRSINAPGTGKVILGATVAAQIELTSDANGKAVAATTGDWVFGISQDAGVLNDVVEFQGVSYKK